MMFVLVEIDVAFDLEVLVLDSSTYIIKPPVENASDVNTIHTVVPCKGAFHKFLLTCVASTTVDIVVISNSSFKKQGKLLLFQTESVLLFSGVHVQSVSFDCMLLECCRTTFSF
ncbi:hypothetical protein Tco_0456521 [Tanacetum coccineum]